MVRQFSFLEDSDSGDDEDAAAPVTEAPPGSAGSSSSHATQATTDDADVATAPAAAAAAAAAGTARQAEEVEQVGGAAFSSAPVPQRFQRLGGEAVPLTFRLLFDDTQFPAMCASGAAGQHPDPVLPVLCGEPVRCTGPLVRSRGVFTGVQLATAHDAVAFVPATAAAAGDAGARCTVPVAPEWTLSCMLRTPLATPRLGTSAVLSLASAAGPDAECHLQVPPPPPSLTPSPPTPPSFQSPLFPSPGPAPRLPHSHPHAHPHAHPHLAPAGARVF